MQSGEFKIEDATLKTFRQKLLQLREDLNAIAQSSDDAAQTVELDQSRVGRLSRMDALQGQQMAQELIRRNKARTLRIEAALQRIDGGEFGYCFECGEAINPRRLEADPTNTFCIVCAESKGANR